MNSIKIKGQGKFYSEFLNVLYENMQCGCCQLTPEESPRLITGNKKAFEIIGYGKRQFEQEKNSSLAAVIYEYDSDRFQQHIYEILLLTKSIFLKCVL